MAGAAAEVVAEGQRSQYGVAARTAAGDHTARAIHLAAFGEITRAVDAIVHVHNSPIAVQALAVFASEAGAAAVVHIQNRDAAAGPILNPQVERARRRRGRAAMALHQ